MPFEKETKSNMWIHIIVYIYTETVLSPWLAADEARVSHVLPHVV